MIGRPLPIGRRRFVLDIGAGLVGGALLGLGFVATDKWVRHPTVAIVGKDDSQVALVLTSFSRVMFSFGPWREELVETLVPLLGWSDRRIDYLFASTAEASSVRMWHSKRLVARQIVLVANNELADEHASELLVDRGFEVKIAPDVRLILEPSYTVHDARQRPIRTPWTAVVQRGRDVMWLVDRTPGLESVANTYMPTVVAVPNGENLFTSRTFAARALACNVESWMRAATRSRGPADGNASIALVRTFERDPALFEFVDGGIRAPAWTTELTRTWTRDVVTPAARFQ